MSCPNTIEIDGTKYVKESAKITGDRHVVVLDRGWVFVGCLIVNGDEYTLRNAINIRNWKSVGFGGMIKDPKAARAVFDDTGHGTIKFKSPIFVVPVAEGWGNV